MADKLSPITFQPIFFERIWGGQKLASLYGKDIPPDRSVGESWEIVDRAEAQSIVQSGAFAGRSLHDLWANMRTEIFGDAADAPRFPLLIKLLDCREKLSLQVHPPKKVAASLGGEPKTECWYVADASPEAELYLGLCQSSSPEQLEEAISSGSATDLLHRVAVKTGDAFFIPSGRIHAIGAGNVIVEVQQNSDTTFRVFDWNRTDQNGQSRELHVKEAMRCINFEDFRPKAMSLQGETILSHELFALEQWKLSGPREIAPAGAFAIVFCLTGSIKCGETAFHPGDFFLLPATAGSRTVEPSTPGSSLLRITIPGNQ
jgi:mannose-6-phosphate isomerase